ncbi:extracellular matrix protein 3-like [Patiria miniata]|uniref:FRAS1-related extracellular matrix protein N-terminal domain-containing protein n=1 Tax=Patiria miniata TaxID=46514 RepID=A0A914AIM9_PATMI|nr:extracellular matrix protein 3-like [Patiria miniata]
MARTLALSVGLLAVLTTLVAGQGADFTLGTTDVRGDVPPVINQPEDPVQTSNDIIERNSGISVAFGRSKVLDPETELKINVQPGDMCVVTVLTDPLSQIPGRLTPNQFPCDFGPGDVKYVHFGSRKPMRDRVKLQLRYDSETSTIIIPFMIDVTVESKQLEIMQKRVPLMVADLMGLSDVLDGSKLEFAYDPSQVCKVTILGSSSGWPRYGEVVGGEAIRGTMQDCADFLDLGLQYRHTSANDSPRMDHIPMVVELQDESGNVVQQEYFQVDVIIEEGAENNPPSFSNSVMMILELNQFVMTAVTPEIIAAEDIETDPDKLVFNITVPLGPSEGYITSTDDRNLPISSFTQKDVRDLKIAYVPPASDSDEMRIFQFELEVVDSELASSEPFSLMVVVNPKNTMAPVATRNAGLTLFEGQSRQILTDQNLEISDENNLWDVVIAPVNGPSHGFLRVDGQPRKFFTTDELRAGVVTYHHDGSETYSDNIIFRMNDGKNETEFLFPITIAPLDDQPPIINVNTGLQISKNELKPISEFVLSATDVDSDDSTIRFILEPPYSTQGNIVIRQLELPPDPQNWSFLGNYYERAVTEWTLDDILNNRLFYRHNGVHNADVVMDRMLFRVADSNPNLSPVSEFVVKILPVDDQPPYLYPGTTLDLSVDEFALSTIRKLNLRYTDQDSEDRNLYYTITDPPRDTDPNNPLPAGQIVLIENPDVPISNFYQSQINHLKIGYKPPTVELGITPRNIQFVFAVQDEAGNLVSGQHFSILLHPVDNKPPSVTNTGFTVSEGESILVDLTMLDAYDTDTDNSLLTFNIKQIPAFGNIMIDGVPMQPGDSFTLDDISRGAVTYENSGAEESGDVIDLELTDGVHIVPVTIQVNVRPVDDEAPTLDLPPGTLGSFLEVPEQSSSLITNNILSASDPDTEDLQLTFIVDRFPRDGILENNGLPLVSFTQQDIVNGYIRYRHTGGEIGLTKRDDSFNLTLSDMSDRWVKDSTVITQIEVFVTILPVDNLAPNVTVGAPFDVDEGSKNTINLQYLAATDIDSVDDDIICTVIVQPNQGYLENISPSPGSEKSRAGIPISAFSIRDLRLDHISYVQSIHQGTEPSEDQFTFACSDGINPSQTFFFPIEINPVNDEEPKIFVREFIVEEGGMIKIDPVLLNGVDEDIPGDILEFHIIVKPTRGDIIQSRATIVVPVKNFTLEQIQSGVDIFYKHDGSETQSDTFTVTLTDGVHEVTTEVNIIVVPVDDETPRLAINDGLDMEIGETQIITNRILQATDLDSPDSNLTFVVRFEPQNGLLQRLSKFDGSVVENITLGMNFTQWEVDNQRIRYVHTGKEGGRDLIKFDVTDGTNPLIDRYFYISVDHIDNVHPDVVNAGVTLQEGGRVTLTTDILSTNDINSPDEDLLFTITEGPIKGHLENTDNPGVPITSFTQLDLAGNKIYYVHTQDDEMRMDSFQFQVTDGFNTVVRTFRISLSEVDNKKPVVTFSPVTLKEGENKLITPFELRIDDTDTLDQNKLKFTITQLPLHGNLLRDNNEIVTMFTMADLNENRISYQHDGSESSDDSFSFIVTDGTHTDFSVAPNVDDFTRTPQKMNLRIVPVDNGMPQIVVNRGAPTLNNLGSGHLGFLLTSKFIRAEDRDSDNTQLIYIISTPPKHGYLMNLALGNISITNFTQADIDNMRIQYVVYPNTNATSDIFFLNVRDPVSPKTNFSPHPTPPLLQKKFKCSLGFPSPVPEYYYHFVRVCWFLAERAQGVYFSELVKQIGRRIRLYGSWC